MLHMNEQNASKMLQLNSQKTNRTHLSAKVVRNRKSARS